MPGSSLPANCGLIGSECLEDLEVIAAHAVVSCAVSSSLTIQPRRIVVLHLEQLGTR